MHQLRLAVLLAIACVVPTVAAAQETASSFDQLRVLVKSNDRLTITARDGHVVEGSLRSLSTSSLELLVNGQAVTIAEADVATIRQRRHDSLANGAKTGFAVGCVLGLVAVLGTGDLGDHPGFATAVVLTQGALFAGIGVGIDAMMLSSQVVLSRPTTASTKLSLSPILTDRKRGVRLALSF